MEENEKEFVLAKRKKGKQVCSVHCTDQNEKTKKKFELGTIDRTFWYGVCVVNALLFPGLCFCFILC